jgi:excisionase family DNA binding protein
MHELPESTNHSLRAAPPLFLDINEAAIVSRLSVRSLRRAITSGRLHAYRVGKRKLIIRSTDLSSWIESYTIEGGEL